METVGNVLEIASLTMQAVDTTRRGIKFASKLKDVDLEEWDRGDYIETTLLGLDFASGAGGLYCSYQLRENGKELKQLKDDLDAMDPMNCVGKTEEDHIKISNLSQQIAQNKFLGNGFRIRNAAFAAADVSCQVGLEMNRGRPVSEALTSPEVFRRICRLITQGSIAVGRPGIGRAVDSFNLFASLKVWIFGEADSPEAQIRRLRYTAGRGLTVPPQDGQYDVLPLEHHENRVFSKFQCPIMYEPCRFPVVIIDNGIPHYYEFAAISVLIRNRTLVNPLTREPINVDELRIDERAQRQIENEMKRLNIPLVRDEQEPA